MTYTSVCWCLSEISCNSCSRFYCSLCSFNYSVLYHHITSTVLLPSCSYCALYTL